MLKYAYSNSLFNRFKDRKLVKNEMSDVRPIEAPTNGQPQVSVRKIEPGIGKTMQLLNAIRPIEHPSTGDYQASVKPIEPYTNKIYDASKYTRKISKFSASYKYEPKNTKKYTKQKSITNNPSKSMAKQKLSPHSFKTEHNDVDKKMKFNLNMSYGKIENVSKYFDRLYSVYPDQELDSHLYQYVFIVRPDLYITNKNGLISYDSYAPGTSIKYTGASSSPKNDALFKYIHEKYPNILNSLKVNSWGEHDFIPFLVGRTESLQIPDFSLKTYKMNQPYTGFNLPYSGHGLESMTGGTFDITFRDDKELRVHKLFHTWEYYIDGVTRNKFCPKTEYIRHNKIDYATSVYCITCKADAETIIFWSKYTGAFPTNVPNSNMSFNLRGTVDSKITIPFEYFYAESLNPYILVDFNKNAHVVNASTKTGYIPVYRSDTLGGIGMKNYRSKDHKTLAKHLSGASETYSSKTKVVLGSGNGLVGAPFICKVLENGTPQYKLRWKKIKTNITP